MITLTEILNRYLEGERDFNNVNSRVGILVNVDLSNINLKIELNIAISKRSAAPSGRATQARRAQRLLRRPRSARLRLIA